MGVDGKIRGRICPTFLKRGIIYSALLLLIVGVATINFELKPINQRQVEGLVPQFLLLGAALDFRSADMSLED